MIFGTVAVALFMSSVDATIVATALPTMVQRLHAALTWTAWTVTAYQLGQAVAMPVAGRVSDAWGRRSVLLVSVAVFVASSAACALSPDVFVLIAFRIVQAVAGGAFMPSATGIVSDVFGDRRDRAVGMFTSIFPLGALVGPVLGGVIVTYWSWRGIFFVNVPIGLVLLAVGYRVLPASAGTGARRRIDWAGAGLLGVTLLGMMLALAELGNGAGPALIAAVAALGGLSGLLFLRRQSRVPDPIVAVVLLRRPVFAALNVMNLAFGACAIGFASLVPLLAETADGLPALQAGTLLTARALAMVLVAAGTSMVLLRVGYRLPMALGMLVVAGSMFLVGMAPPRGMSAYTWLAGVAAIMGIGVGMAAPSSNNAVLDMVPDDIASVAGLRGTFRQTGAIIGVSVTTAVIVQAPDQGRALAGVFRVLSIGLLAVIPLVLTVPRRRRAGEAAEPPGLSTAEV